MNINQRLHGNVTINELSGRLDATSVGDLKDTIRKLAQKKLLNIVIDLAGVDFVDSSGLGGLVSSLRTINKEGGDIKIASLRSEVRPVFELTRLHRLFEIFDNPDAAAASF